MFISDLTWWWKESRKLADAISSDDTVHTCDMVSPSMPVMYMNENKKKI